jgi:hypothetical protein
MGKKCTNLPIGESMKIGDNYLRNGIDLLYGIRKRYLLLYIFKRIAEYAIRSNISYCVFRNSQSANMLQISKCFSISQ